MSKSKYINTFNTTAEYENYINSAFPNFPNVAYDKETGNVQIRKTSPNNYLIWGTTTATENFYIKLNTTNNVEVTVDSDLGEFYLESFTGTLTSLSSCFYQNSTITSIKKFTLDVSSITNMRYMFSGCNSLRSLNLTSFDATSLNTSTGWDGGITSMFVDCNSLTDVYIDTEVTLMKLTNNLSSQGQHYIPSSATIHYNGTDYKWQNNAWTPQS